MRRKFYEQGVEHFAAQQMRGFWGPRAPIAVRIANHRNKTHVGLMVGQFDQGCEMCRKLKTYQDGGEK